jgi:enterochelin esterase family protein
MTNGQLKAVVLLIVSIGVPDLPAQESSNTQSSYPFRAADDSSSARIEKLRADVAMVGSSAVEEFWAELEESGAPIIEAIPGELGHSLVTFVWRGSEEARNVVVTNGVALGSGGLDPLNSLMTRIDDSDVWYRSYAVRNDGSFTYKLSENDPLTLFTDPSRMTSNSVDDPLNGNRLPIIGQTYVKLPDAPTRAWVNSAAPDNSGEESRMELNGRMLRVYTPAGFNASGGRYPLLFTMAGGFYADMIELKTTLDHSIAAGTIPPLVAVVVSSTGEELECSSEFSRYLAEDLVPWVRTKYHATADPRHIVIAGASAGGLASSCAAVSHPDVFGNVLSQSGSYWWNLRYGSREEGDDLSDAEWLTSHIESIDRVSVEFYVEAGLMEFDGILGTNRRFRNALIGKGYTVEYREFNGNHSYLSWRESFGDGLAVLLGE